MSHRNPSKLLGADGRSDAPTAPFSNEDDLLKLLDAKSIDRAVLVGSSGGGLLAINFTLNHPDRVSAFLLVGAVVDGLGFSEHSCVVN